MIDYLRDGVLPDDDKKAKELVLSCEQFVLMEEILYFAGQDKMLRVAVPNSDRRQLFEEAHSGPFGGHLREAKVHHKLARRYWWPKMRRNIVQWCQACLVGKLVGLPGLPSIPYLLGGPLTELV